MNSEPTFEHLWWLTRLHRLVATLCWRVFLVLYAGIGLCALALLFVIETQFFWQMTQNVKLAYIIAGIVESAKVGTSVIKQALTIATQVARVRISVLLKGLTVLFQVALIGLSLICTFMVITSYLDGTYPPPPSVASRNPGTMLPDRRATVNAAPHTMVTTTMTLLQESFGVTLKAPVWISGFALLLSALLQAMIYIIFGHILATQAQEIEQIFLFKLHQHDAKKNSTPNR